MALKRVSPGSRPSRHLSGTLGLALRDLRLPHGAVPRGLYGSYLDLGKLSLEWSYGYRSRGSSLRD